MAIEVTHRRSPGEKALAEEIAQKAKKRKPPSAEKFRKAKRYCEAAQKSDRFEFRRSRSSVDGLPIHYFRTPGETLTGIIGEPQAEVWGPSSYPFLLDDGRLIRVPGNRRLALAIRKADALFQRIKITFKGKLWTKTFGHCEKVYLVELVPLGKEPMTQAERDTLAHVIQEAEGKA
jgi:hypothetical protein